MTRRQSLTWCVGLLLIAGLLIGQMFLAGCNENRKSKPQKVPRVSEQPPAYPAKAPARVPADARESARAEIARTLAAQDPVLRANAVEATQVAIGRNGAGELLRALDDPHPLVRFAGAMAAGTLQLREAQPALLRLTADHDQQVFVGVRYALHRLGDTRYSRGLEESARSDSVNSRANTAVALGLTGDKSALKILRQMQRDSAPPVRLQVAEAMWRLGDEEGLRLLINGAISGAPDERIVSVLALAAPRDHRVIQHVRANLVGPYPEVCLAAARAMGQLGSDEGYGVATMGGRSSDPRHRALAALAFGAIGRADSANMLVNLLKDGDQNVRLATATALLQLKDDAGAADLRRPRRPK